jgi:ribosomal protein S18 acetylase RimI-like enzyme
MDLMPFDVVYHHDASGVRVILEPLPDWFGGPEAVTNYERAAGASTFRSLLAVDSGKTIGVALVDRHFPESAELHLIAVSPNARGHGIGNSLVDRIADDLKADGCRLLSVHTVGPSFESEPYAATRAFYRSAGFHPLEEHDGLDWSGPTLILMRMLEPSTER